MARIILVEDDLAQQEELLAFLALAGHDAEGVASVAALECCLQRVTPDIVLLDYNLPDGTGQELAEQLRQRYGLALGIVMITARGMAIDRIACRRAGADDYLVKPADFQEMLAIIEQLLARLTSLTEATESWTLYRTRSELVPPLGAPIRLAALEIAILAELAAADDHRASRDNLIRALGRNPLYYDPRALEALVSRLRRKLPVQADGDTLLQSARCYGYQFLRPLVIVS